MNITGQRWQPVLVTATALTAAASTDGSAISFGYSRLVGICFMTASGATNAVNVYESADEGTTWHIRDTSALTANSASVFSTSPLHGNAVKVMIKAGATCATGAMQASFYISPV